MPAPRLTERSPSAALLRFCLLGLACPATTSLARGRGPSDPDPDIPRCTPVAPRSGITVSAAQVSAPPGGARLNALAFDEHGAGWMVGSGGAVLHRPYTRSPWTPQPSGITEDLRGIHASVAAGTWAAGAGGTVLRWQEAGWQRLRVPVQADLEDIAFWTASQGAVVGAGGAFLATLDGGERWTALPASGDLWEVEVTPQGHLLALGAAGLLHARLDAEGGGWSVRSIPTGGQAPLRDVYAWSDEAWMVADAAGEVWSTLDSGATWRPDDRKSTRDPIRALLRGPLGVMGIHQGGGVVVTQLGPEGTLLVDVAGYRGQYGEVTPTALPPLPAGLQVVEAGGSREEVVALTADGRILQQGIVEWFEPGHPCGRPFEVDHRSRLAPPARRSDWLAADFVGEVPDGLSEEVRAGLARAWLEDARAEHASVASFARFSLRLLALGAPASLLAEAQQAMGDEIRHAQLCFALASRYAGQPLGPGPLPMDGALGGAGDLRSVSVEVLREGAVGESIGALLALEMSQRASDPGLRAILEEIAEDEARHAQMAWRFLRWALDQGGEPLRAHLADALEQAIAEHLAAPVPSTRLPSGHGRLQPEEQRRILRRCLHRVVRPCAEALLARQTIVDHRQGEAPVSS